MGYSQREFILKWYKLSRKEVLQRMRKLDVLYKELDILDEQYKSGKIVEIDYLIKEEELKKQIDVLFEVNN